MLEKFLTYQFKAVNRWARRNLGGIFLFNLIILLLILLRFAGYFAPFFSLNTNLIFLISLFLSIFLLRANSRVMFVISLAFWLLAMFLKLVKVDIWADRSTEYFFQALAFGVTLLIFGR